MSQFSKKAIIYFISSLVFSAVLFLSSCTAAGSPVGDPVSPASSEAASITEDSLIAPPQVDSEILVTPAFTTNPIPDEFVTETPSPEPDILPTVRPDLHATDPKAVMLASGKPQLIEFFAYW